MTRPNVDPERAQALVLLYEISARATDTDVASAHRAWVVSHMIGKKQASPEVTRIYLHALVLLQRTTEMALASLLMKFDGCSEEKARAMARGVLRELLKVQS